MTDDYDDHYDDDENDDNTRKKIFTVTYTIYDYTTNITIYLYTIHDRIWDSAKDARNR